MVTRSIVGRILIMAVLVVSLGVIAQAALILSREPGKAVAKADGAPAKTVAALAVTPAVAAPATAQASPATADAAPVRVVYPGPLGDVPLQPRKIADAAPASPIPAQAATLQPAAPAVQPAPAPVVAAPAAAPVVIASADAGAQPTVDPAASAKGGVSLNSASADALNHLGGGHIGQTIIKHRPYHSVEDLVKKRVVRRSVYDQIKDQVAAD